MARCFEIIKNIRNEILTGRAGDLGERFMTVRELAGRYDVSLVTAQKVISTLKKEQLLISDSTNPAIINHQLYEKFLVRRTRQADKRIGLIVTNGESPFFNQLSRHVQNFALNFGYSVLISCSEYDYERERRIIEGFADFGIKRLLVCPGLDDRCSMLYNSFIDKGIKIVFLSRRINNVSADSVVVHNFQGAYEIADHFFKMGYETFGYIGRSASLKNDPRLNGYRYSLVQKGKKLLSKHIIEGDGWGLVDGYRAMDKLMNQQVPPRAVFAYHDLLAIGALQYCIEHGLDVPGQIAIAGFDNLPESVVTIPALTTVAYPIVSMAKIVVQTIISDDKTSPNKEPHNIILQPKLVVRSSSDKDAVVIEASRQKHQLLYQEI